MALFSMKTIAQCAGLDHSITICEKENFDQGLGNGFGVVSMFDLLEGTPNPGGVWSDNNGSGGLDINTGILNTFLINQGGVFTYTYTADPACDTSMATITVVLSGFPGITNTGAVACDNEQTVNLFSFLGSNPSATFDGVWTDDDATGALSGQFIDASIIPPETPVNFSYTVPAAGTCSARSAMVTVTVFQLPNAGTPMDITFCETDDFTGFQNFDLNTLLTSPDAGGIWIDNNTPSTGEITTTNDFQINIENIATTFGDGTYSFQYTVNPTNPICPPQSAVVNIIIEPVVDLDGATITVVPNPICFADLATTALTVTLSEKYNDYS